MLFRSVHSLFQKRTTCPSGCICSRPEDMETDDILLNYLMEVEIIGLLGVKHEIAFVERLLRWAGMLNTITLTLDELARFTAPSFWHSCIACLAGLVLPSFLLVNMFVYRDSICRMLWLISSNHTSYITKSTTLHLYANLKRTH